MSKDVVNKLIKRFKTNNPFEIAEKLNIIIKFEDMDIETRGFYFKILRRKFIVINSNLSDEWKRFVCAHELGHERLHPKLNRFQLDEQSIYNAGKYEKQAHYFAISLLTHHSHWEPGETFSNYLVRNNIPREISRIYLNHLF